MTTPSDSAAAAPSKRKSFDIFVIDTTWNKPISKAVRENLKLARAYLDCHRLYVLTPEQSTELLKQDPAFIGHDPIILVVDRERQAAGCKQFGVRVNYGLLHHTDQAAARMHHLIRFITDQQDAADITRAVRRDLQKSGFDGAMKTLLEAAVELR